MFHGDASDLMFDKHMVLLNLEVYLFQRFFNTILELVCLTSIFLSCLGSSVVLVLTICLSKESSVFLGLVKELL